MNLTAEQVAIVDKSRERHSFAVKAFAGSGKTSTAVEIAKASPNTRMLYLAFNKKVADEAKTRFPSNTTVKTAHSLAFAAVGKRFADRLTTSTYQLKLGLAERFEKAFLTAGGHPQTLQLAFFGALEGLNTFFATDHDVIDKRHVPEGPYDLDLVIRITRGMWSAMTRVSESTPITHDTYMKLYQLGSPRISADVILLDEAQDSNPALLDIVLKSGIPTIFIGDPWQSIYQWRGAVDAFGRIGNLPVLPLSSSWRFGPAIANQGNAILKPLGERQPLKGLGGPSDVTYIPHPKPDAVVARTTQGLIGEAVTAVKDGRSIHVVGGTDQIFEWLLAATDLMEYGHSRHRQFAMFKDFAELREVSEMPIGAAFRPYVSLVDTYGGGTRQLVFDLEKAHKDPQSADVVLSSAHRFKGQEAPVVRLAGDFAPFATIEYDPKHDREYVEIDLQEANLAYVSLTRGRTVLDLSSYDPTLRASLEALALHAKLKAA